MKKQILFFSLLLLGVATLRAEILETKNFREISSHVNPDTLVLLDIDDTLLIPNQMLGCDEWFKYRMDKHKAEGMTTNAALDKTVSESEAVRQLTQMHLVEPGAEKIVQSLQEKGVCVMGLTVQGFALAKRTSQQLITNGFDLTKNALSKDDQHVLVKGNSMLYRNGVIFTTGTNKGEALTAMLDKLGYTPKRIVFVDDKASNLVDVEKAANKLKIEFIGLRYGFSDPHKAAFRPEVADVEFTNSTFDHLLSDKEALAMMSKSSKK